MTLNEIAARIIEQGGTVASHFTVPRADGSRLSVWGEVSAGQFSVLLSLVESRGQPSTPEARARAKAHFVHDESVRRRR